MINEYLMIVFITYYLIYSILYIYIVVEQGHVSPWAAGMHPVHTESKLCTPELLRESFSAGCLRAIAAPDTCSFQFLFIHN